MLLRSLAHSFALGRGVDGWAGMGGISCSLGGEGCMGSEGKGGVGDGGPDHEVGSCY